MRKGQSAGSAAAFLAIFTVLIILYILFLPPDIREDLLADNVSGGTNNPGGDGIGSTDLLLRQSVGKISYIKDQERYYDIPTVRVSAPTSGQLLKGVPSIAIKNALFDKEQAEYIMNFDVDKKTTTNIVLSFNVRDHYGPIIVTLNGNAIFNGEIEGNKFLKISDADIGAQNELKFTSPNPGVIFWKSNRYEIDNVQLTGDVTDYSASMASQQFTLSAAEKENLDSVTLYFRPVCTLSSVGPLEIQLNKRIIFNSVADCGTRSFAGLDTSSIQAGANELRFSVEKGSYLLDNLMVKVMLEKPTYKTYYFDIDNDLFEQDASNARCGDYDGECPVGCADIKDADCCFDHNGNWCGLPTRNGNDRCVYYVDPGDCDLCPTGYYDDAFDIPDTCEGRCGDNDDGICPSDCPTPASMYDSDCCYEDNNDNFFCQEVPLTGISDRCRASVSYTQCDLCPSGFENEDGSEPDSCDGSEYVYEDLEESLNEDYDARLIVRFVDDEIRKRLDLNINGHRVSIDTTAIEYKRNIDDYVRPGTNSIEIIPREDIEIAELSVELIRVN